VRGKVLKTLVSYADDSVFAFQIGFNAIISLVSVSLTCSYVITISCVIWHRLKSNGLPKERFSLGRAGIFVNIAALCTMSPIMVLAPFPPSAHVTASTMNYAILIFGVVILFSVVYYIVVGRKRFVPTLRKNE
jgi:choline transport protein